MTSRRFRQLRTPESPIELDYNVLYGMATGYLLLAGCPESLAGFVDGCHVVLPGPAAELVKRVGVKELRRLCELEKITQPGEKLWCETLKGTK